MSYRLIGLDLALSTTGFSVFDCGKYQTSGIIIGEENVVQTGQKIIQVLEEWKPQHFAIEDTFVGKWSSKYLDRLHGVILFWISMHPEMVYEYLTTTEWRKLVGFPAVQALKSMGITNKTNYYKKKSLERAKTFDDSIKDHNQADAVNIADALLLKYNGPAS